MLTTASQFGPRARSLRTNHATATASVHRVLAASSAATVQQCQQTRDFRFGWFSHTDSEVQEEMRRREKAFKQKYADQLSRRLNWDKHPLADDARHAVKRMMASYWISHDARPCGRHADAEASKQRTPDNKDGVRPGQNIEDVERGAMEHLMFGKEEEGATRGQKSKRKRGGKKNKHNSVPYTPYGIFEHDDYFIDPVTNRKVAKHAAPRSPESGVDIPVKTFKDYRTRFTPGHGVLNDEPSAGDRHKHSQVEIDTKTDHTGAALDAGHSDASAESHTPTNGDSRHFQVDTPNARMSYETLYDFMTHSMRHKEHGEPLDLGPKYDDLHKYKPVTDDGQVPSERPQQLDNEPVNYKPVTDNGPVQFEDLKPPYEDLHKYDSAVVDEVVARFEGDTAPYSDLHRYGPVLDPDSAPIEDAEPKHNEPQEKSLGYQIYSVKPGVSALDYRPSVENLEPGDFPPSTVEQLREKYGTAELRKYTTVRHLSPGEERLAEEAEKIFDSHEMVYYNEPDGSPLPTADERVVEDLTKRYDPEELAKYSPVYWNEPDGQPDAAEDSRVAEGLTKEYDPAELAEYKPVYWNEPDGQPRSSMDERAAEGLTKNYDLAELHDYERPVQWNEPDGQPPMPAEELSKKYPDLDQYAPIGYQEPEGHRSSQADAVKEGLEEMDARRDYESADRLASEELDSADEPSAEVLRRMDMRQQIDEEYKETERRQILEQQMKNYQTASDATDHEASLAIKYMRARAANVEPERQLTGNYVRDFPEEFDKSWTETLSKAPPETAQPNDDFVFESQDMDGGLEGAFGRPSPAKIQPALDRHLEDQPHITKTSQTVGNEDSGSIVAQDLDTVDAGESGGTPVSPAYAKHSVGVSPSADKASEATTPETIYHWPTNEPTLYKILAYDPVMQKIEIAETSSFVPDTASALTPADALLRLSHPTRFFPHFARLEAEGYEIISGTGDVLVFRKVRPETSKEKPAEKPPAHDQPAPTSEESGAVETRINPIDMTGRPRFSPASANFASPTGYVNYDNIPETAASKLPPPPPKIKYNIDVHREEPVFSGPKARSSDGQRGKKKSLGKRLVVGGVWVAGISYALGVITEFFTTGGMDGIGPKGL